MGSRLSGRRALVTGGGSGIGAATARAMSREGAAVAVVDIVGAAAESVASEIRANGGSSIGIACDVSDEEAVRATFDDAESELGGPVDALFNNAGIAGPVRAAYETPMDEFDRAIAVNFR